MKKMVKKYNKNIVLFSSLLVLLISVAVFINVSNPTGYFVKEQGVKKLGNYMAEFLEVEDYVFETNSNGCVGSAKKLFKDFINIKPEQIESFIVNDDSGFANFAFTEVYDSGTLSIIKGSEFLQEYNKVRLTFNAEKMVFTKYSDKTKSINLNLTINGFVEENILVINSGAISSEGVNCLFN